MSFDVITTEAYERALEYLDAGNLPAMVPVKLHDSSPAIWTSTVRANDDWQPTDDTDILLAAFIACRRAHREAERNGFHSVID